MQQWRSKEVSKPVVQTSRSILHHTAVQGNVTSM